MMKTIQEMEAEIIQSFQACRTIDEKYTYLFQLGENLTPMNPAYKTDQNLVRGCQSLLWFHLLQESGRFYLLADSDSMVVKGISALLVKLIEGRTAQEIQKINMDFVDQLQIWKLASDRNNGLMAMLDHIHQAAKTAETQRSVQEDDCNPT